MPDILDELAEPTEPDIFDELSAPVDRRKAEEFDPDDPNPSLKKRIMKGGAAVLESAPVQAAGKLLVLPGALLAEGLHAVEGGKTAHPLGEGLMDLGGRKFKELGEEIHGPKKITGNEAADYDLFDFFGKATGIAADPLNLIGGEVGSLFGKGARTAEEAAKAARLAKIGQLEDLAKAPVGRRIASDVGAKSDEAARIATETFDYGKKMEPSAVDATKAARMGGQGPQMGFIDDMMDVRGDVDDAIAKASEKAQAGAVTEEKVISDFAEGAGDVAKGEARGKASAAADLTEQLASEGAPDLMTIKRAESLDAERALTKDLREEADLDRMIEGAAAKMETKPPRAKAPPEVPVKQEPASINLGDLDPTPPAPKQLSPTGYNVSQRKYPDSSGPNIEAAMIEAKQQGYIGKDEIVFAGKVRRVNDDMGKITVTEWQNEAGEVVGATHTWREGGKLTSEFVPSKERLAVKVTSPQGYSEKYGWAEGQDPRYLHQPGGAQATATATKPGKAPTVTREQALREANQELGVYQRLDDPGELPYSARGEFKKTEETIVNRFLGDPDTGAHELGHYLDKKLMSPGANVLGTGPDLAKQGAFLDALGKGKGGTPRAEGWAEAIRFYVNDPDALTRMRGGTAFRDWLASTLRSKNPKAAKVIETLRDRVQAIKGATPSDRIGLFIKEANDRALGKGIDPSTPLSKWGRTKMATLDYTAPAEALTKELRAQNVGKIKLASGKEILDPAHDMGLYAREMRNQGATFHSYYHDGVPGTNVPGLKGIIEKGGESLDKYAVAKWNSKHPPAGMDPKDVADFRAHVAAVESNPEMKHVVDAFNDVGRWNEAIYRKQFEAGMLSKGELLELAAEARAGAPLKMKDAKGSTISPLGQQTQAAMEMLKDAELNEAAKALEDVSKKFEGTGKWLTRHDAKAVPQNARERVEVLRDGKVSSVLHVDKDLWRSFKGLEPRMQNMAMKIAEGFASGFTVRGVEIPGFSKMVTGHVGFGVPAFMRAVQNSVLTSRAQTNPLSALLNALGVGGKRQGGMLGVLRNNDLVKQAMADKAFLTGWASLGSQDTAKVIAKINKENWFSKRVLDPISRYLGPKASMTMEKWARMGEYEAVLNKMLAEGVSAKSARRMAADAARALDVDMLTRGANDSVRFINAMTPFLNPAMQGWSNDIQNVARLLKTDPGQFAIRMGAFASVPIMAHMLSRHDPRMKNISADQHARWEYFSFGKGDDAPPLALPRPNGIAGVWAGTVRLLLDNLDREHPEVTSDIFEPFLQGAPPIPLFSNPLIRAAIEVGTKTKSVSSLSDLSSLGKPVVPISRQDEPGMQGRLNPVQVERLGNILGGSLLGNEVVPFAMDLMNVGDTKAVPEKGTFERVPGITYADTEMPRPVKRFYDEITPLKDIEKEAKALKKFDPAGWREYAQKHADDLRRLSRLEKYEKKIKGLRDKREKFTNDRTRRNQINQQMSDLADRANRE